MSLPDTDNNKSIVRQFTHGTIILKRTKRMINVGHFVQKEQVIIYTDKCWLNYCRNLLDIQIPAI